MPEGDRLLFTPGRASYMEHLPHDEGYALHLTPASEQRAEIANVHFDEETHRLAVFAGGYPGLARKWPPEQIPATHDREAHHMARPLQSRLIQQGWEAQAIASRVKAQGNSMNSIGDVLFSIQEGYINPDDFHNGTINTIDLVAGGLHGARFRTILSKSLAIAPNRIQRVPMTDIYGTSKTELDKAELAPVAIAKEIAAIAITKKLFRKVRDGNLEDVAKAEEAFIHLVAKNRD